MNAPTNRRRRSLVPHVAHSPAVDRYLERRLLDKQRLVASELPTDFAPVDFEDVPRAAEAVCDFPCEDE